MVECFDRIHLRLSEVVVKPLQRLQSEPGLSSVTIRPPGRGQRVQITVDKSWTDGRQRLPVYDWSAREVDASGGALLDGRIWSGTSKRETPEAAYWDAVDTIAASRSRRSIPD